MSMQIVWKNEKKLSTTRKIEQNDYTHINSTWKWNKKNKPTTSRQKWIKTKRIVGGAKIFNKPNAWPAWRDYKICRNLNCIIRKNCVHQLFDENVNEIKKGNNNNNNWWREQEILQSNNNNSTKKQKKIQQLPNKH